MILDFFGSDKLILQPFSSQHCILRHLCKTMLLALWKRKLEESKLASSDNFSSCSINMNTTWKPLPIDFAPKLASGYHVCVPFPCLYFLHMNSFHFIQLANLLFHLKWQFYFISLLVWSISNNGIQAAFPCIFVNMGENKKKILF